MRAVARRLGALLRKMPQSVYELLGTAGLTGICQTGGRLFNGRVGLRRSVDIGKRDWRGNSQPLA